MIISKSLTEKDWKALSTILHNSAVIDGSIKAKELIETLSIEEIDL